jgi:regulator of sirC expression with transglutaminase-like and TPR domain
MSLQSTQKFASSNVLKDTHATSHFKSENEKLEMLVSTTEAGMSYSSPQVSKVSQLKERLPTEHGIHLNEDGTSRKEDLTENT